MLLNPFLLTTQPFTVLKDTKKLVAEASSCGIRPGVLPYGPLYDDAADVGITLLNLVTTVKTHWYMSMEVMLRGEVAAWVYKPCPETVRRHPHLADWEVHIQND